MGAYNRPLILEPKDEDLMIYVAIGVTLGVLMILCGGFMVVLSRRSSDKQAKDQSKKDEDLSLKH